MGDGRQRSFGWVVFLVVGVLAIGIGKVVGLLSGEVAEERPLKRDTAIITAITAEDSEGATDAEFDLAVLKKLELRLVEGSIEKARRNYVAQGFDPKTFTPTVETSSVSMTVGGKKLGVVKATINNQVRSVWIIGLTGGALVRVTCIRASNQDIPILSGECGAKVTEAFGVSIRPQNWN